MARKHKLSDIEMSFDGLTDSVTNLVGSLILLVVLLLCVTRQAMVNTPPPPHRAPTDGGNAPIDELLRQTEVLRLQIESTDQHMRDIESEIPALQDQLDEVREELKKPSATTRNALR